MRAVTAGIVRPAGEDGSSEDLNQHADPMSMQISVPVNDGSCGRTRVTA